MPLFSPSPNLDPLGFGFPVTVDGRGVAVTAGTVQVASRGWWMRVTGGGFITAIRVPIAGTGSTGTIDVGVYANSGTGHSSVPGARKASSGAIVPSTNLAGNVSVDVSLTAPTYVNPGDWFAITCADTTRTFATCGPTVVGNFGNGMMGFAGSALPLADPAPTLTSGLSGLGVFLLAGV